MFVLGWSNRCEVHSGSRLIRSALLEQWNNEITKFKDGVHWTLHGTHRYHHMSRYCEKEDIRPSFGTFWRKRQHHKSLAARFDPKFPKTSRLSLDLFRPYRKHSFGSFCTQTLEVFHISQSGQHPKSLVSCLSRKQRNWRPNRRSFCPDDNHGALKVHQLCEGSPKW